MFNLSTYIPKDKLTSFCRKYSVQKLALFGSALRDELRSDSDIDLLIEFEDKKTPGLISFCGMENELTEIAGRKVDLRTPKDLSKYFRAEVLRDAKVQYAVA